MTVGKPTYFPFIHLQREGTICSVRSEKHYYYKYATQCRLLKVALLPHTYAPNTVFLQHRASTTKFVRTTRLSSHIHFHVRAVKHAGIYQSKELYPVLVWVASDVLSEATAAFEYLKVSS